MKKLPKSISDATVEINYYQPDNKYMFIRDYIRHYGPTVLLVKYSHSTIEKPEPKSTREQIILDLFNDDDYSYGNINRIRLINKTGKASYTSNKDVINEHLYKFPISKLRTSGCISKENLESTIMCMHEYDINNKLYIYGLIPVENKKFIDLSDFEILM